MSKRVKFRVLFLLVPLVILLVVLFNFYTEKRLRPMLQSYAEAKCVSATTLAVNNAVCSLLENEELAYKDLTRVEYGEDGKISGIHTDVVSLNRLKSKLSASVVLAMEELSHTDIKIPLGTVVGGELFYGKGPQITVQLIPVGGVQTDISNKFTAAGINQTRHQILFTVSVSVSIILPSQTIEKSVSNEFFLAETVIVGQIPDVYVN